MQALDCGDGVTLKLAPIPAGAFLMGSPVTEEERSEGEVQHRATITKPFYMGVYPVTQAQYRAVMGDNPSKFGGADLPVERVNWDDAVKFCQALSQKAGRNLRLPTEAEWEYACRAGTTTPFNTGENISTNQARYNVNQIYGNGVKEMLREGGTVQVGTFPANAWGLHDMHGNVWEWCSDWQDDYPTEDATNPRGPTTGMYRVLRGGSWSCNPSNCRSASRCAGLAPGCRAINTGFRVAMDL